MVFRAPFPERANGLSEQPIVGMQPVLFSTRFRVLSPWQTLLLAIDHVEKNYDDLICLFAHFIRPHEHLPPGFSQVGLIEKLVAWKECASGSLICSKSEGWQIHGQRAWRKLKELHSHSVIEVVLEKASVMPKC